MILTYLERLICLIVVVTGLVHIGTELVLYVIGPVVLRVIAPIRARQRERLLYALQLMPMLLAMLVTGALCIPQYLRTETNLGAEKVSLTCIVAGFLAVLWYGATALRGLRVALRTVRFLRACKRAGSYGAFVHKSTPVVVCPGMSGVALVGLLRPFILVSENLIGASGLSGIALEVVLDHECSHARQRDNWKLFLLNFVPTLQLRLHADRTWRELWQNTAEWAADDDAVRDDSARLLVLADTLVAVARQASPQPAMVWATLASSGGADFAARIDRLLTRRPRVHVPRQWYVLCLLSVLALGVVGTSVGRTLPLHNLPEHVLHLR